MYCCGAVFESLSTGSADELVAAEDEEGRRGSVCSIKLLLLLISMLPK